MSDESQVIAGFFGLGGVLLGVVITSVVSWKLKSKEARLRILEKIFDKRLNAHEEVLEISRLLRTTVSTKSADEEGNVITYAKVVSSREIFDNFLLRFNELVNHNSHWFDIELVRELNFVQDYLANIDIFLKDGDDDKFGEVAILLKQDFTDLAYSLEQNITTFFDKDIYHVRLKTKNQHHKYPVKVTIKRLNDTELFKLRGNSENKAPKDRV